MSKRVSILLLFLAFALACPSAMAEGDAKKVSAQVLQNSLALPSLAIDGYRLDADEIQRFYAARNFAPVWDAERPEARASVKTLAATASAYVTDHGLVPERYPGHTLSGLLESGDENAALKIEILTTAWLLRLANDLSGRSVNLAQLYPGWTFKRAPAGIAAGLQRAIDEKRVFEYIGGLAPSNAAYLRLMKDLNAYREMASNGPWPHVTPGPTLRPGERDSRVQQIRARLQAEGYTTGDTPPESLADLYDTGLQQAVETYQSRNGLEVDAAIGVKTVAAMNVPIARRLDQIMANMERWRQMPENFPQRYAVVNIADASVDVMEDGRSVYHGPVVVGRPDRKTPFIQSAIRSVIFNPSWHVPAKIARKDILPKLRKDPHYLEKMGFVIKGSADDPHGTTIDWDTIRESAFHFQLRQTPGDINSLGRLKFDFDNDFAVYMHGTPHPELFEKAERNKSSGCVRLRDPELFASIVLSRNEGEWSTGRVEEEIANEKTRWLRVEEPLPVYFVYWTVFSADGDGPVNFRTDVYNYDSFLIETLRTNGFSRSGSARNAVSKPLT